MPGVEQGQLKSLGDDAAWLMMLDSHRNVLVSLASSANPETGACPSWSEALIRKHHRTPKHVTRILDALQAAGWITRIHAGFNKTTIFVNTSRILKEGTAAREAYFFKGRPKR